MIQPPLWEVMHHAFWKCPKENWRLSSAYMIRALRDWLVPEMEPPVRNPHESGSSLSMRRREYAERQRLRALLTAEADRAEKGQVD